MVHQIPLVAALILMGFNIVIRRSSGDSLDKVVDVHHRSTTGGSAMDADSSDRLYGINLLNLQLSS